MTDVRPGQLRAYRDEFVSGNRIPPVRVMEIRDGRVYYMPEPAVTSRIYDVSIRRFEYWYPEVTT